MPQSLIQLPKTAEFVICGERIRIKDHRFMSSYSYFFKIMSIIKDSKSDSDTLYQFEKHGISYEATIEHCAYELEHDADALFNVIYWIYRIRNITGANINKNWNVIGDFSESGAGGKIAEQIIEKIRSCENWGQLYEEMHPESRFSEDMKKKTRKEMIQQQCRKV